MIRHAFTLLSALLLAFGCAKPFEPPNRTPAAQRVQVAAVQYAPGAHGQVSPRCAAAGDPDLCAILLLVDRAAAQGAKLVVTPEYALAQPEPEQAPRVGDDPGHDPAGRSSLLRAFSRRAKQRGLYLVINLQTRDGADKHNSQVAFGPDGRVQAVHHKFELYAAEGAYLTRGREVTSFDTPFGRVGLLVCADLYGDLRRHDRLTRELGARVIAVSSQWTVPGADNWPRHFARNWGVHVVAANTTNEPGRGGGVFSPHGQALALRQTPGLAMATITLPYVRRKGGSRQ